MSARAPQPVWHGTVTVPVWNRESRTYEPRTFEAELAIDVAGLMRDKLPQAALNKSQRRVTKLVDGAIEIRIVSEVGR